MKGKILNFLLIIASFIGYLEWSTNKHIFLFQAEAEIFSKLFSDPFSVIHPFTILPMAGQMLLLVSIFQKSPGKILTYTGIGCLGLLLVLMFVIGLISVNYKIICSVIPFIVLSIYTIRYHRMVKKTEK